MTKSVPGPCVPVITRLLGCAAVALLLVQGLPAHAEVQASCTPHLRATANVSPDGLPLVTLQLAHGDVHLLLDTGAERTTLTEKAVRKLGLVTIYHPGQNMQGVGGNVAAGAVRPGRVSAGGMVLRDDSTFAVIPVSLPPVGMAAVEGLLGADLLQLFDLDLDIQHHLILFYDSMTCADPKLPWTRPYAPVTARLSAHAHLVFPVALDGRILNGFIDTGAQLTTVDADAAAKLGVTELVLADDAPQPLRGVSGEVVVAHEHVFGRMTLAGEVLRAPLVMVTPLRLDDADLLLGANFLGQHRVWLSYASRHLYVEQPH